MTVTEHNGGGWFYLSISPTPVRFALYKIKLVRDLLNYALKSIYQDADNLI